MVQVPIVEQNIETRALGAPTLGSSIRPVSDPYVANTGMTELAKAVKGAANQFKDRGDQVALMEAQRKLDDWEARNLFDPNTGYLAKRGKDAFDGPASLSKQWDSDMEEIGGSLGNADQQFAFQKMAQSRRGNLMQTIFSHERKQMDTYADETAGAAKTSAINRGALNFNNDKVVEDSINAAKAVAVADARRKGLPEDAIVNDLLEIESKVRLGVLTRMADSDPKAAIDYYKRHQTGMTGQDLLSAQKLIAPTERKYKASSVAQKVLSNSIPKIDQDSVINYVMTDLEGGAKVVKDSNGALAKYGINAEFNADLFANGATPTEEQARQRYKERYWKTIDADNLPPDMRLAAFHFSVNAGPDAANKIIAQSGGDARKMVELQAQFYQNLATKNPEKYGPQLQGWMNRLARVNEQINMMHGQIPNEADLYSKIDRETPDAQAASDAKEIVKSQIEAIKRSRKEAEEAASTEAWRYKQNGMEVPPSVVARMNPKTAQEMQSNAPPDPAVYESLRQQIINGEEVDLEANRWKLGKKYDDLVELKGDPVKQAKESAVDDVVKSSLPVVIGNTVVRTPDDYKKVEQFRRVLQREAVAESQARGGKPLTMNEIRAIGDRLTIDAGNRKKIYQIEAGDKVKIGGIPYDDNMEKYYGGVLVSDVELVTIISKSLNKKLIPVTPENIEKAYNKLFDAQAIIQKDKIKR